jgi:hypothetical protein
MKTSVKMEELTRKQEKEKNAYKNSLKTFPEKFAFIDGYYMGLQAGIDRINYIWREEK